MGKMKTDIAAVALPNDLRGGIDRDEYMDYACSRGWTLDWRRIEGFPNDTFIAILRVDHSHIYWRVVSSLEVVSAVIPLKPEIFRMLFRKAEAEEPSMGPPPDEVQ